MACHFKTERMLKRYLSRSALIILLLIFFILDTSTLAQEVENKPLINEVFHHTALNKVLKRIQAKYGIKIAYANEQVETIFIDVILENATVEECFNKLLHNTSLESSVVGDNIIITPRQTKGGTPTRFNFTVSGVVVDGKTGETLPNVSIQVRGTAIGTTTNKDGYFSILQIPTDTTVLEFRYIGYSSELVLVRDIDNPLDLKIKLRDEIKILENVIISDEYNQALQIKDDASTVAYNPKTLPNLPSLGEQDVFRTLQLMPGVGATDESSSGMSVRGMDASENLVLLDGITIYQLDHLFGAFSFVNTDIVKDVRVYKGPFNAKYGGRVSGVIDITTKNGNAVKPAFHFGSTLIGLRGTGEIPISPKVSLLIGGRRSYTDVIQSTLFKRLYDVGSTTNDQVRAFPNTNVGTRQLKPSYYFYDVNAKLSYKPSQKDIISLSFYNSVDHLYLDGKLLGDTMRTKEDTRWGNEGVSLRWGRQWNKKLYSNLRLSNSTFFRSYELNSTYYDSIELTRLPGRTTAKNNIRDISIAIDNELLINDNVSIEYGFSKSKQFTDSEVKLIMWQGVNFNSQSRLRGQLFSIYGTWNIRLGDKLSFDAGSRINYYDINSNMYLEPRFSIRYTLTERIKVKGAYSISDQFINQLKVNNDSTTAQKYLSGVNYNFWTLDNIQRTDHYVAGMTWKNDAFTFDCEFYYKKSIGVVDNRLRDGTNITTGADIIIQKTTGIHKGWLSYSLLHSRQSFSNFENAKFFPSLQDQRHEIKIVNMITLGKWNFSTTWIYGSGKPYQTYTLEYNKKDVSNELRDYRNSARLPAYDRLDITASYKVKLRKSTNIEVGLSIFNVYNKKNFKNRRVITSGLLASSYDYVNLNLMDFTPSLFLNISF